MQLQTEFNCIYYTLQSKPIDHLVIADKLVIKCIKQDLTIVLILILYIFKLAI